MKVFVKILKVLATILLVVALVAVFWVGVFNATGNPEIPIPLPVGLLEPPSIETTKHLYDVASVKLGNSTIESPLGFPIFNETAFDEDGAFIKDALLNDTRENIFGNGTSYDIQMWEENPTWDLTDNNFDYSKLNQAIYLFNLASYNERMVSNFAYLTEAGGSASLAGVTGMLMSQSIRFVNRIFDEKTIGKYQENYFNQQVNAMYKADAPALLRQAAEQILKVASRSMNYGSDYYGFSKAFSPAFIEYEDESLTPDVKEFYKPFLATGNRTVAAGRCSADWEQSVERSKKETATGTDFSKYIGNEKVSEADKKSKGYQNFSDIFSSKFIVKMDSDVFYNEKTAATPYEKPYVNKVWVDANGNKVDEADGVRFYYDCRIVANVASINAVNDNMTALKSYTGADPGVKFTQLVYEFSVWDTGVFRHWHTLEGWFGTMVGMITGEVLPNNPTYFAYNIANTYIEDYVKYVVGEKRAESEYGITYKDGITYKNGKVIHDTTKEQSYFDPSKESKVDAPPLG